MSIEKLVSEWAGESSLITLDIVENRSTKVGEEELYDLGDFGEDTNDSGYYCDSDSGVSSLYETIKGIHSDADAHSEHELESFIKILNILEVNTRLHHLFFTRHYSSKVYGIDVTYESILDSLTKIKNRKLLRKALLNKILNRQKELLLEKKLLDNEKQVLLQRLVLLNKTLANEIRLQKLQKIWSRIEVEEDVVNLVWGLEMRILEKRSALIDRKQIELIEWKLEEAMSIKIKHDENIAEVEEFLESLGNEVALEFKSILRNRRENICKTKVVERMLFNCSAQATIINTLSSFQFY